MIIRPGREQDIGGIISLQSANLHDTLLPEERKNGFVTTPFSETQLLALLAERGVFVAEQDGAVAGYALAGSWSFFSQWPIFPFMVSRFGPLRVSKMMLLPENSFQYGPVCIAAHLRGRGILPLLFGEMRRTFARRYPIGVTFINRVNGRSYAAHARKLGLIEIDAFEFSGRYYSMLAFMTADARC